MRPPDGGSGDIVVRVVNRTRRPIGIGHVATAWPYRRQKLSRRLEGLAQGHPWSTVGWSRQKLPEIDAALQLPTRIAPRDVLEFTMPMATVKGAWKDDVLVFVVRVRDVRGRSYYSPVIRTSR